MKIKVEGSGISVTLTVDYRSWTPTDDSWSASPKGIIGGDMGQWTRQSGIGGYDIVFYGSTSSDQILLFEKVTATSSGNPFKKGQSGSGLHLSLGGSMLSLGVVEWNVISV